MSTKQETLELWGGVECTINRVGDRFHDQLEHSGHRDRCDSDLERFGGLGLRTLRTALNWEHVQEHGWASTDALLQSTDRRGFHPIAGLLHHGSGPQSTCLMDPSFPEKFAAFALSVAQRYPSLTDYTPINEPQTTGRFACLYGHWYPHHRSMRSYVRALFHQIKGIVLAMESIRSVQPNARLIHTEDGGAFFSSPALERIRIQREHRRWLGLDLLCGRVDTHHPLFNFLLDYGLSGQEVLWFRSRACPPAVIGINYYVTSDRFLDEHVDLYPSYMRGGDFGDEPLVDVEAVRIRPEGIAGAKEVIVETWNRYGLPVAITEAHLGCDPAEQRRWLAEIWSHAEAARAEGADVRAVTAWGLLGLYDWCHLCTQDDGKYEAGVFDISDGRRRASPLAHLVRQLASGLFPDEADLRTPGWWRRNSRINMPPTLETSGERDALRDRELCLAI